MVNGEFGFKYNANKMAEIGGRVLAVDWGGSRIGIAISDETRTLARPLIVIQHISRRENAEKILRIANTEDIGLIVVGVSSTNEDELTPSGRSAKRLLMELESQSSISVTAFDEYSSTKQAKANHIAMGSGKKKRRGHLDAYAAAIILQAYLDQEKANA